MRSFKTSINWKLSGLLTVGSWITGFLVLPFTFSLVALPPEIPLAAVIAAQMVQLAVLLSVSCYTGLRMAKTAGLPGAPVLEGILKGSVLLWLSKRRSSGGWQAAR